MKLKSVKKLKRDKVSFFSRKSFLRLDKNEKVDNFNFKMLNKINLNSFDLTAYPEVGKVYKLLAKNLKIPIKQLVLTSGSDFGIRTCFDFFCRDKKPIICLKPTFGMVDVYAKLHGIRKIEIDYDNQLNLNLKKLFNSINRKISLIIIANPNSPTGTIIDKVNMNKILIKAKSHDVPVLIDEAYQGFCNQTYINDLKKFNNLIILRTFSKSCGLAGLRAGYLVSNEKIINELDKFKPMYEINSAACKVLEILLKKKNFEKKIVNHVLDGKKYFQNELDKMNLKYLKTFGNFLHVDLGKKKNMIEQKLKNKKILTRKGPGVIGYESYLRFTLGPKKEMKKVVRFLKTNV